MERLPCGRHDTVCLTAIHARLSRLPTPAILRWQVLRRGRDYRPVRGLLSQGKGGRVWRVQRGRRCPGHSGHVLPGSPAPLGSVLSGQTGQLWRVWGDVVLWGDCFPDATYPRRELDPSDPESGGCRPRGTCARPSPPPPLPPPGCPYLPPTPNHTQALLVASPPPPTPMHHL